MSRLEELIEKLCPDGVEYKPIADFVDYEQPGKYIVKSTKYDDNYEIPVLTAGQSFILGYTDETDNIYQASKENPVIIFDDFTGAFKWVDFPFKVKSSAMKILTTKSNGMLIRYLFHVMGKINFTSTEHKRLWISYYSQLSIPVPPLEVQREIVRVLDSFTLLTAELTAELTARCKQYEYYRENILERSNQVKLGNVCKVITKGTTPKEFTENGVNFIKTETFKGTTIDTTKISHVSMETHTGFLKRSILHEGDILLTIAGATIGKCAMVPSEILPANTNQALAIIRLNDEVNKDYVMHILQSSIMKSYIKRKTKGSAQPNLTLQLISEFPIPLPDITEQNRIASILNDFAEYCDDITSGLPAEIEARKKQYEYYRDKLLTFKEKA